MEYKFKNEAMLEVSENLVIVLTNPLVCYLIIKMSYAKLLLITKLMFLGIEFEVSGEASYTYNDQVKPRR